MKLIYMYQDIDKHENVYIVHIHIHTIYVIDYMSHCLIPSIPLNNLYGSPLYNPLYNPL